MQREVTLSVRHDLAPRDLRDCMWIGLEAAIADNAEYLNFDLGGNPAPEWFMAGCSKLAVALEAIDCGVTVDGVDVPFIA